MSQSDSVQTPFQRLMVEKALALGRELEAATESAPRGGVLDACEGVILASGHQFLREALAASLQAKADASQKKILPSAPAAAAIPSATRARRPRP